ncbi:MAG TPA: ATP-grasp domain-containing protein [Candidatus Hydrogenedentes bacterium]|nr:ATP-grasp domain-containing protein [Candidatus Hydrogenedentota bacterium]
MTENVRNRTTVLVFPCGTEIGLEIHRALCQSAHVALVGASSVSSNHGAHVFARYVEGVPYVADPSFASHLNRIVEQHAVDLIYPAHDDAVVTLARHESELGCAVIGSPLDTCALCRSKSATYARFTGALPTPRLYAPTDAAPTFPLFLKPDAGQGSHGARKISNHRMWEAALSEDPTLIAMEYLPGAEYTVDCFTDRHGVLRFIGPRERIRTMNGISVHTRNVPLDDDMRRFAETINAALVLRGAWFFQLKRGQRGALTLLEIAPRVSGGMGLYRNLGVNLPLLSVYDRLNIDLELCPLTHHVEMDRALTARFNAEVQYAHVYVDLDDTLLQEGKVNIMLIAFLHQCRNHNKQLHLLTRHRSDVADTLAKHGLSQLFDSVIHVKRDECKAACVSHTDAIFIDDSFSERRVVREKKGLPVFAPDAVELLMDWRR